MKGKDMRRLRAVTGVVAFVLGFALGYWLRGFIMQDSCLDSGGRWRAEWNLCERR